MHDLFCRHTALPPHTSEQFYDCKAHRAATTCLGTVLRLQGTCCSRCVRQRRHGHLAHRHVQHQVRRVLSSPCCWLRPGSCTAPPRHRRSERRVVRLASTSTMRLPGMPDAIWLAILGLIRRCDLGPWPSWTRGCYLFLFFLWCVVVLKRNRSAPSAPACTGRRRTGNDMPPSNEELMQTKASARQVASFV